MLYQQVKNQITGSVLHFDVNEVTLEIQGGLLDSRKQIAIQITSSQIKTSVLLVHMGVAEPQLSGR